MAENTVFDSSKGSKESIKKILIHSSASSLTPTKIITDSRLAQFKSAINTSSVRLSAEDYVSLNLVDKVTSARLTELIEKSRGILDTNQQKFLEHVTKNIKVLEAINPDLIKGARSLNKDINQVEISKLTGAIVPKSGSNITLESIGKDLHIGIENPEQEEVDEKTLKLNQDYLKDLLSNANEKYEEIYPEPEDMEEFHPSYKTYVESRVGMGLPSQYEETPQYEEVPKSEGFKMPQEPLKKGVGALTDSAKSVLKQGTNQASLAAKKLISGGVKKAAVALAPLAAKAGVILAGLGLLLGLLVSAIVWTIIFIVGFIFLAIVILFIINSGAYVVPPGGFTQVGENPYIKVVKMSDAPLSVDNSWNNQDNVVTYTITVSALEGTLSNISFNYSCNVISENPKSCPAPQDIIAGGQSLAAMPPTAPSQITSTTPYIITYKTTIRRGAYNDSLITDSFTVTASPGGQDLQTVSGSRSLRIGNPPTGCFKLVDEDSWPDNYRSNILSAISNIISDHMTYVVKVCGAGDINIQYDSTPQGYWGYHLHGGDVDIILYSGGLQSVSRAEFIVAHESAHHLGWITDLYDTYLNTPGLGQICSYPTYPNEPPSEDFAEMIGQYVNDTVSNCGCFVSGCGSFQSSYPNHYEFARSIIFEE
jgi:hypothetical protein